MIALTSARTTLTIASSLNSGAPIVPPTKSNTNCLASSMIASLLLIATTSTFATELIKSAISIEVVASAISLINAPS